MNYNYGYTEHKGCKPDIDCAKCKPKSPKPKEILLECGEGTGSRTFTSSEDTSFQLAHVTVDTGFLNKPKVLIKFSSLVKTELGQEAIVRLRYELFRVCDGRQPLSLGMWMFEKNGSGVDVVENVKESFNFTFCECLSCNGCCDYFVTVTPIEITNASATVDNGRMAALAQALCDDSNNKRESNVTKHKCFEPDKIILTCGSGTGAGQAVLSGVPADLSPINLAQVTIDTTCLNKPRVLIEFSSIVKNCNSNFTSLVLQFELFKVCGDGEPISCGIWTFEQTFNENALAQQFELQRVFSFIFCECTNISECCMYFVKVTPLEASTASTQIVLASWEVYNTQISAYAQSSKDSCLHYNDCKSLEDKDDCLLPKKVHPKPKKILLECGSNNGSRTFTSSSGETPFQLANVTIDTTGLCKPIVNIEFSSTANYEIPGNQFPFLQLQYELFRACDGGVPISIGTWIVDRVPLEFSVVAETFNFTYCDCITCPSCCDYFVTVMPIGSIPSSVDAAIITVSNGRIDAMAQEA